MNSSLELILEEMRLNDKSGLIYKNESLEDYSPRIKNALKKIEYDAIYNFNKEPFFIFKVFNKAYQIVEEEFYNLYRKIWNFSEALILIVIFPNEIRIYNGQIFEKDYTKLRAWKKILLDKDFSEKIKQFSFKNIYNGQLLKEYNEKYPKNISKNKFVYNYLLKNLTDAGDILFALGLNYNEIHNIITKLIFTRYLIDKGFLDKKYFLEKHECYFEELILDKYKLKCLFDDLKKKFDGDIFEDINNLNSYNDRHLDILYRLFKGHEIKTGQTTLFDLYDFSIIPIELISNVYEKFLNQKEKKLNKTYYTPIFLVEYILNNILDEKIMKNKGKCKILDPACGSGIFLVESLIRMIDNDIYDKDKLKDILINNIYGIDKDEDAINITILSLYIALLDYIKIDDFNDFILPTLKNKNLFVADFFDEKHIFNKILKENKMDVIVGNPPWGNIKSLHLDYCKKYGIPTSHNQIAQSFLVRVKDFSEYYTEIALISTSKILYNYYSYEFRKYFFSKFKVNEIFEFSSVREKIFHGAIGPGAIIFYNCDEENIFNNSVKHISLKSSKYFDTFNKIFIDKNNIKYIKQELIIKEYWILCTLVHGNILDIVFIKRLKNNFDNLNDISSKYDLITSRGIQIGSIKKYNTKNLIGRLFIDVKKNIINRYKINYDLASSWNIPFVERIRDNEIYDPPSILLKESPDNNFNIISAYNNKKIVFTQSITAIKGTDKNINILKNILGILNSDVIKYYLFMIGSSTGIERGNIKEYEKLSIPIVVDSKIIEYIDKIIKNYNDDISLDKYENKLNEYIYNLFEVNEMEKDLIDYVTNVSIPLYNVGEWVFPEVNNNQLISYANIFINYFKNFCENDEYFYVEIYKTEMFIAMNFKFTNKKRNNEIIFKNVNYLEEIINEIGKLSLINLKETIYIQKDIKGFEKSSFYIIKPKEINNWHNAIARLDLYEFIQSIKLRDMGYK